MFIDTALQSDGQSLETGTTVRNSASLILVMQRPLPPVFVG